MRGILENNRYQRQPAQERQHPDPGGGRADGGREKGAETRLVNLRELEINGCLGCEACKKHLGRCIQKDDLATLMQAMTAYDAVVMGTPVYWYQVAGQFKLLVDRLYSFFAYSENPETGVQEIGSAFPAGKKGVFVVLFLFGLTR